MCKLPKKIGDCKAAFPKYYFNSTSGQCESFTYGGCGGNGNNFNTKEECEQQCQGTSQYEICLSTISYYLWLKQA